MLLYPDVLDLDSHSPYDNFPKSYESESREVVVVGNAMHQLKWHLST